MDAPHARPCSSVRRRRILDRRFRRRGLPEHARRPPCSSARGNGHSAAKLADNPEIQYHLGLAHYMLGDEELARTALQKAVQLPSAFPQKEETSVGLWVLPTMDRSIKIIQLELIT